MDCIIILEVCLGRFVIFLALEDCVKIICVLTYYDSLYLMKNLINCCACITVQLMGM